MIFIVHNYSLFFIKIVKEETRDSPIDKKKYAPIMLIFHKGRMQLFKTHAIVQTMVIFLQVWQVNFFLFLNK